MVPAANLGILTGTTASGKTQLALEWARKLAPRLEIVNADSLLVYRGFDIGTAKPTEDERGVAPHHLIDIREPGEPFTAGDFKRAAEVVLAEIAARGNRALIVGGTGFYLKALTRGLWNATGTVPELREKLQTLPLPELHARLKARDPEAAARIGETDQYRLVRALELIEHTGRTPTELEAAMSSQPDPRFRLWITDRAPHELNDRIRARAEAMLERGLLEETRALQARFPGARPLGSVGYAECVRYLEGTPPRGRAVRAGLAGLQDEIELSTRQLVKKQRTWFRGQHKEARWFELDRDKDKLEAEFREIYEST